MLCFCVCVMCLYIFRYQRGNRCLVTNITAPAVSSQIPATPFNQQASQVLKYVAWMLSLIINEFLNSGVYHKYIEIYTNTKSIMATLKLIAQLEYLNRLNF